MKLTDHTDVVDIRTWPVSVPPSWSTGAATMAGCRVSPAHWIAPLLGVAVLVGSWLNTMGWLPMAGAPCVEVWGSSRGQYATAVFAAVMNRWAAVLSGAVALPTRRVSPDAVTDAVKSLPDNENAFGHSAISPAKRGRRTWTSSQLNTTGLVLLLPEAIPDRMPTSPVGEVRATMSVPTACQP